MNYVILIASFLLDGILSNFCFYVTNDLYWLYPLFTLMSIWLICPMYQKEKHKYYITAFIMGLLYDLFYTNLLFTNAILFLGIAVIFHWLYQKIRINWFTNIIVMIFQIIFYQCCYAGLLVIFNVVPISLDDIFYLIFHSLLLNIIYGMFIYGICHLLPRKRRVN